MSDETPVEAITLTPEQIAAQNSLLKAQIAGQLIQAARASSDPQLQSWANQALADVRQSDAIPELLIGIAAATRTAAQIPSPPDANTIRRQQAQAQREKMQALHVTKLESATNTRAMMNSLMMQFFQTMLENLKSGRATQTPDPTAADADGSISNTTAAGSV